MTKNRKQLTNDRRRLWTVAKTALLLAAGISLGSAEIVREALVGAGLSL